ncbi:copper amine oxidase N-terminal domain-containing protein [Cohnella abietis]|uniref:Copper amine oxidase-like N-terminal domain-containing protein n=1 Tax=Cohnella abietis TaxID=2507935 RepID=A0A3T1DAG0_9BACL|nr:copper amine oxidase N-terminal domain-containing protein [Cohnella abietis]BBI35014.1 hypothetical protein KCTCHS21_44130 [Cohnella abietis]
MRKVTVMLLVIIMGLLSVGYAGAAADKVDVSFLIDGKTFKTPAGEPEPYVNKDQRTMVSLRFFASAIGMPSKDIKWDNKTQTATLKRNGNTAEITVGNATMKVNKTTVVMDTKAEMKKGRLFIPVRYMVEALGVYMEWNAEKRLITIKSTVTVEPAPKFKYVLPGDEIFEDEQKLNAMTTSPGYFVPNNGKFLFSTDPKVTNNNYTLKEKLNPDINRQIYDATKVLLDENHFVGLKYHTDGDGEYKERVFLTFSKSSVYDARGNHFFKFIFMENDALNNQSYGKQFSDHVSIMFSLERLWPDDKLPTVTGVWAVPFYENKMRASFFALYGQEYGDKIADYILNHYIQKRTKGMQNYKAVREVKTFGKIQVDFADNGESSTLDFTFSYKK